MTRHVVNFNAGPAGLPRPALERAQAELLDFQGTGMAVMEHSHRGKGYEAVHQEALQLTRELLRVPESHDVLLLQGGASQLFATVPMNFLPPGKSADYIMTGNWADKALAEAKLIGTVREAGSGLVDGKPVRVPRQSELSLDPNAAYLHFTSNNTIEGTQFFDFPDPGAVPLVADMSSDFMWRPIDVSKFNLIYAGAQKNVGPSGLVVVIIHKAWMATGSIKIPSIFRFKTHADNQSMYNTPPTFSIYLMRNVLAWIKELGGLPAMEQRNREKARVLYGAIDASAGFYRCPVEVSARSVMNVVWRLPTEQLEEQFVKEATKAGLEGLKGHRIVGGIRASTYNAVSVEGVTELATFMREFQRKNG